MESLKRKIVAPHSTLIEETALNLACEMYEIGRRQGMTSKHPSPRHYAKAYLEKYIPLAVHFLLEQLNNPATSAHIKDCIYDALLERSNDEELSNSGIEAFRNDTPHLPDVAKLYEQNVLDEHRRKTEALQEKQKHG